MLFLASQHLGKYSATKILMKKPCITQLQCRLPCYALHLLCQSSKHLLLTSSGKPQLELGRTWQKLCILFSIASPETFQRAFRRSTLFKTGVRLLACHYEYGIQIFQILDLIYLSSRRSKSSSYCMVCSGLNWLAPTLVRGSILHFFLTSWSR